MPSPEWLLAVTTLGSANLLFLDGHGLEVTRDLNGGVSFSFWLDSRNSALAELMVGKRAIKVYRGGVLRAHGRVWEPIRHGPDQVAIEVRDPWSVVKNRRVRVDVTYTATDAGTIAWNLIALQNGYKTTRMRQGSIGASVSRDRTYEAGKLVGEAVEQLAGVSRGFYFTIDPVDGVAGTQSEFRVVGPTINICPNPSFETNNSLWSVTNATIVKVVDPVLPPVTAGDDGGKLTAVAAGDFLLYRDWGGGTPGQGNQFTISGHVYLPPGDALIGKTITVLIQETGGTFGSQSTSTPYVLRDGWQRVSHTHTFIRADRTTAEGRFTIAGTAIGQNAVFDAIQFEHGLLSSYVDGDQPLAAWNGTAHASSSVGPPRSGDAEDDVLFEFGDGTTAGLEGYEVQVLLPRNRVVARGGEGTTPAVAEDAASITEYDLYEEELSFTDVTIQTTLQGHADAELRPAPIKTYTFDPGPDSPMLWDHFDVGDIVRFRIKNGPLLEQGTGRVTSATVQVGDNGSERLSRIIMEQVT